MKVKVKKSKEYCQIPGCKKKAAAGCNPKGRMDLVVFVCDDHLEKHHDPENSFDLWKYYGISKPEKLPPLINIKKKNSKPKKEGKSKWQEILDGWFGKGKYPSPNFMNPKRWDYWISIGGEKPQGDSRKFNKSTKLTAKVRRKK